ncbi:MAG: DNA polymerase III subunit alpha [Chthoniobacterales bacterium]|nr:DNA polymerase III subunit alpha [Chthoniobacterales bacterium]
MPADEFVHLHLHTEYSLLDGAVRMKALMEKAAEMKMPAVAITDHGNLHGAIEFYQAATSAGIKPIIGVEAYMAPGSIKDRPSSMRDAAYHFTLLARDEAGYKNLVRLISTAHLEGMHYKPRIDRELLAKHSEGLIGMSGCLKGEINMAIQADQLVRARETAATFRDILGPENFFLELHDHGMEEQKKCNRVLPAIAKEFGLGLVAANDVHFLERAHHAAHDVMLCIGTGKLISDEKRMHYKPELYFKGLDEMRALFGDHPESLTNTVAIAERCNLKLDFGTLKFPEYEPPPGKTRTEYLHELCEAGLRKRYGDRAPNDVELRARLTKELAVIETTGFVSYFLIVWDFIHFAKQRGIPVGPGRGSAAGSLIAYVLEITDIDPLQFGLLFERFLNPERVSPPDIDVDFCEARRGEVLAYVRRKYGERRVSQIITFGKLKAKSVVRDVGRVMGLSYGDADRIAKMIPNELGITLASAAEKTADLKRAIATEPATKQLWEFAGHLEGLSRNAGVHAAGVVISDRDLSEYVPLCRDSKGNEVVTQYAMGPLTDLGLLKMDFLGLKTLTVIEDTLKLIHQREPDFSLKKIPLDDAASFSLFNRGETIGLFQMESGGMTNVSKQLNVEKLDDIIALIALYRPGPMDLIPEFIAAKRSGKVKYAHPLLEEIAAETYGVLIYQEQVMAAANKLAGYSLGQSDLLRRAMGKKDKAKMAKERDTFIAGCATTNKIPAKKANEIFDLLEKFAGYGFNKSHSAAYGVISYQTAYLKANYPVEFMAGLLSNEINNTDKISIFVGECKRMGITILPPDMNRSGLKFTPESCHPERSEAERNEGEGSRGGTGKLRGENFKAVPRDPSTSPNGSARDDGVARDSRDSIRFGLAAIKNVGEGAMASAIAERERGGDFTSLEDFCSRVDSRIANRKIIESLIKAGAFDFLERDRAELFACSEETLASAASSHRDRAAGQVSLFGDLPPPAIVRRAHEFVKWTEREKMSFEKELLGFYVTGHPLDAYAPLFASGKYQTIASLGELSDRASFRVAGAIAQVERKFTKKEGKPFAVVVLEDLTGTLEVVLWNETYAPVASALEPGTVLALRGTIDKRDEAVRATAKKARVLTPENIKQFLTPNESDRVPEEVVHGERELVDAPNEFRNGLGHAPVTLRFAAGAAAAELRAVREILAASPGAQPVRLMLTVQNGETVRIDVGAPLRVALTPALELQLARWLRSA